MQLYEDLIKWINSVEKEGVSVTFHNQSALLKCLKMSCKYTHNTHYSLPFTVSIAATIMSSEMCV